jgi:hypothetical protein
VPQNKPENIMRATAFLLSALFIACAFTACYKMPTEDDCSLVPMTNNPDVTRDRGPGLMPTVNY